VGAVTVALAADRQPEIGLGVAAVRTDAEELDDFVAGFAMEKIAGGSCLRHFVQAVGAKRFHQAIPEKHLMLTL